MSAQKQTGVLLRGPEEQPIQIPLILLRHQTRLGSLATLLWVNLVAYAQQRRPLQVDSIANVMGVERSEIEKAMVILADHGWINDEGLEIRLTIPQIDTQEEIAATAAFLDEDQAAFEWLVSHWAALVGDPSPNEMRKLLFWMEKKQMSHEVIAVAIEEMITNASIPSFPYLEGILRNWYAQGVRSYNDLQEKPSLTNVLPQKIGQDADTLSPAEQKWKEVFPDEFGE